MSQKKKNKTWWKLNVASDVSTTSRDLLHSVTTNKLNVSIASSCFSQVAEFGSRSNSLLISREDFPAAGWRKERGGRRKEELLVDSRQLWFLSGVVGTEKLLTAETTHGLASSRRPLWEDYPNSPVVLVSERDAQKRETRAETENDKVCVCWCHREVEPSWINTSVSPEVVVSVELVTDEASLFVLERVSEM